MTLLARPLARLVGTALLALIAVVGIAAAVFCIQGGHGTLSLAGLAADAHLPQLRDRTVTFIDRTTAPGAVAVIALLCGIGAILIGLLLIVGTWLRPRPRRVVLARTDAGTLGTLRRPLARLAAQRAEQPEDIGRAHARARARRRRDGGRIRVRARATVSADRRRARRDARDAVDQLIGDLPLRIRVSARRAPRRERRARRSEAKA